MLVIAILSPAALQAQQAKPFRYGGSGYGYFAAGGCRHGSTILGGGGGAEAFLWKGLTLGVEGAYQTFPEDFGFGELYAPVGYHFVDRTRPQKWDPFVSAGVVGFATTGSGATYAMHFGGGTNYWFKERIGLRTEFRVHGYTDETTVQVRVGVVFR